MIHAAQDLGSPGNSQGEADGVTVELGWLGYKIFHRDRPTLSTLGTGQFPVACTDGEFLPEVVIK